MQLLYGNDGNNYRTLAKTSDMNEFVEKELKEAYLSYPFVGDESPYSSVKTQPVSLTYVTTNLGGALLQEQVLLCQNARMSNFQTPSSYAHFQLMDPSRLGYGREFFRSLRWSFLSDAEAVTCSEERLEQFEAEAGEPGSKEAEDLRAGKSGSGESGSKEAQEPAPKMGFAPEVIKAIAGLIFVEDANSTQIRVVLDVAGDGYNARSLEFVEAVYRLLPCDLRKRHGFCTYGHPGRAAAGRIKLIVMEPSCLTQLKPGDINLKDPAVKSVYQRLPQEIREYVDYLSDLDEEEREDYFASIFLRMNGRSLSAEDYLNLHKTTSRWNTAPLGEIFEEWLPFALKNAKSKSPVAQIFRDTVTQRLEDESFHKIVETCLQEQETKTCESWDKGLFDRLAFAELFAHLTLPVPAFVRWEEELLRGLHGQYQEKEFLKAVEAEQKALAGLEGMGDKFIPVREALLTCLCNAAAGEQARIEEKIQRERERIASSLRIDAVGEIGALGDAWKELAGRLSYPEENLPEIGRAWVRAYLAFLEQADYFYTEAEYKSFEQQIRKAPEEGTEDQIKDLTARLRKKHRFLEEGRRSSSVHMGEGLAQKAGERLEKREELRQKGFEVPEKIELIKEEGRGGHSMTEKELASLLEFLLSPSTESAKSLLPIFSGRESLFGDLLHSGSFGLEHKAQLLRLAPSRGQEILKHYLLRKDLAWRQSDSEEAARWLLQHCDKKELHACQSGLRKGDERAREVAETLQGMMKEEREQNQMLTFAGRKALAAAILMFAVVLFLNLFWLPGLMAQPFTIALYVLDLCFLGCAAAGIYFYSRS